METAKQPPQNLDAEASLIGSLLLDTAMLDELADIVRPGDFYLSGNGLIFETIQSLRSKGNAVDAVLLLETLQSRPEFGGENLAERLNEFLEKVPHPGHAKYYAEIVRDKALRRAAIYAATDLLRECYLENSADMEELIGAAESKLHSVLERQSASSGNMDMASILISVMGRIGSGKTFGLASGFQDLDRLICGFQDGSLYILAARTSVGKTALAIRFMLNVAKDGAPIYFASLEQGAGEVVERMLSMESGIPVETMRQNHPGEAVCDKLLQTSSMLSEWKVLIDENSARTVSGISSMARLMVRKHGVRIIVVDYLQLILPTDNKANREQQVAAISRGLKLMAKSLKVPVVCLAQLNRQVETRSEKRPRLSDLRESGAIEQDADVVLLLDRPATYDADVANNPAQRPMAKLIVAKHRNGKTGDVELTFDEATMNFRPGYLGAVPLSPPGGYFSNWEPELEEVR